MPESTLHQVRFPGESDEYRSARNEVLRAEIELRKQIEELAALRSKLPRGGKVKEDYVFEEMSDGQVKETRLSELFTPGKDTLIIYSYMFGPDDQNPCPMCTSFIDTADASVPHVTQRINFAVVAKSPIERIYDWASKRGWKNLRLLSSGKNSYNTDYFAETPEGGQLPACNVFIRTDSGIYHFYSTELLYAKLDGQPRHIDLVWPLYNFFDMTPEGRGLDWYPQLSYSS